MKYSTHRMIKECSWVDLDFQDFELWEWLKDGSIKYENGLLTGKTYPVKEVIKLKNGMAGKWNKELKGWEVDPATFERELKGMRVRYDH